MISSNYNNSLFNKCLIISKCESRWHPFLVKYLRFCFQKIDFFYLNNFFKNIASAKKIFLYDLINDVVNFDEVSVIIFDLEFSLLLSPSDVKMISEKSGCIIFGIGMDDDRFHDLNRIMYGAVNAVLTFPLSVERYALIGKKAYAFFPSFELVRAPEPNLLRNTDESIDVLFFGLLKGKRKKTVAFLRSNGIDVVHPNFNTSDADLVDLIRRSKLVLNLSSGSPVSTSFDQFLPFSSTREERFPVSQLKSRIFEVGSLGSLCVTDTFAGYSLSFPGGALPCAEGDAALLELINRLLSNSDLYNDTKSSFLKEFSARYSLKDRITEFRDFVIKVDSKRNEEGEFIFFDCRTEALSLATKITYSRSPFVILLFLSKERPILLNFFTISLTFYFLIKILYMRMLTTSKKS